MQYEIEIENSEKLFIPKHKDLLKLDHISILLLWGGRYGAKSESVARMLVIKCLQLNKFKCIVARKVFNTLQESAYRDIKDFIINTGLEELFKLTTSPLKITCKNGNEFLFRGFDKPKKIKGVKNPTHFWYEEFAESEEEDYDTGFTTLRGCENPQFIATFNPESKLSKKEWWLYNRFFDRNEKDFEYNIIVKLEDGTEEILIVKSIHTTHLDNPYLARKQKAKVEQYRQDYINTGSLTAEYNYIVWTRGEFGDKLPEMPFLHEFSKVHHVTRLNYDDECGIHVSLDINVVPYLPCSIWQYKEGNLYQIREITLKHPFNRTKLMGKEIVKVLRRYNYRGRVYIYGDSTAVKDDTNLQVGTNFYTIIKEEIEPYYQVEMRVPKMRTNKMLDVKRPRKNPNVRNSGEFVNDLLKNKRILIDKSCIVSINDYTQSKQDPDGGIDKKEKCKETGGQKHGHILDCLRYICCEILYDEYKSYIKVNRRLL